MPSLPVIEAGENEAGVPVLPTATATAFRILQELGLRPVVPCAGRLLSGGLTAATTPLTGSGGRPQTPRGLGMEASLVEAPGRFRSAESQPGDRGADRCGET